MKKALISRYAAYGDIIHCSHLPRLLKDQGFDIVDFETNTKGKQLLANHPFIDNLFFFEPSNHSEIFNNSTIMIRHWDNISKDYDKFVNLHWSLEYGCIAMEDSPEYYMHEDNRKFMREINFYDQTTKWAGYPELLGKYRGEIYFSSEEYDIVEKWMKKFEDKFVVMMNLSGTTIHKVLVHYQDYCDYILDTYKDAHIILTGDSSCESLVIDDERITSIVGKFPFRQAAHITRYVDCLLTMESGIGVMGNMWGTPTIQMMTSSSKINHPNNCIGDFSLQSPARCSPCSKGPYRFFGCPHKEGLPECIFFDFQTVKDRINETYQAYKENRFPINARLLTKNDSGLPILRDETPYHSLRNS